MDSVAGLARRAASGPEGGGISPGGRPGPLPWPGLRAEMWAPHLANNDGAVKKQKTSLPKIPRTPRGARAALRGRPPTPRRRVSQAHPGPPGLLRAPQRLRGAEGGVGRRKGAMRGNRVGEDLRKPTII